MHLHRRFGDADLVRNLFVEAPGGGLDHDLALAWAERVEAFPECSQGLVALPAGTIAREPGRDRIEEILIAERFCQELDGTVIGMSPCAVMKIIGRFLCAAESSHWRSRPLRPGILTSTTRQVGPSGAGSALRYSETHENCRLSSPTVRSSRPTDSRNSASSSIIRILGFASTQHHELKGHVRILLTICHQEQPLLYLSE